MQNDKNITDFTNQKNLLGSETAAPKFVKTAHCPITHGFTNFFGAQRKSETAP